MELPDKFDIAFLIKGNSAGTIARPQQIVRMIIVFFFIADTLIQYGVLVILTGAKPDTVLILPLNFRLGAANIPGSASHNENVGVTSTHI